MLRYLIYKSQCVCAYISAIKIQTPALILMKFGMETLLNAGKVPSWVATPYPHPRGQGALNRVWPASAPKPLDLVKTLLNKSCRASLL
jgi:hypothetical protein